MLDARFRLILHHELRNKEDIEDILQEALAAVARDYRTTEYRQSFAAWCARVLRNRMLMHFRARDRDRRRMSSVETETLDNPGRAIDPGLQAALSECLRRICAMNKRYARILALSFQGYDITEICNRLDVTANNAYSILSRARSKLAVCLDERDK